MPQKNTKTQYKSRYESNRCKKLNDMSAFHIPEDCVALEEPLRLRPGQTYDGMFA